MYESEVLRFGSGQQRRGAQVSEAHIDSVLFDDGWAARIDNDLREVGDPVGERARLVGAYEAEFASPYVAAARGYVDEVIKPSETRPRLIRSLEVLADKQETNPRKKHGNIPL